MSATTTTSTTTSGSGGGYQRLNDVITSFDKTSLNDEDTPRTTVATNLLAQQAVDVRANRVNWQSYLQGNMIKEDEFSVIHEYDTAKCLKKDQMLTGNGAQCCRTFLNLMRKIATDKSIQYILSLIDDLLEEKPERVVIFYEIGRKGKTTAWNPFLAMLTRNDPFIINQAARIICKIVCWSSERMFGSDLEYFMNWIKQQLIAQCNDYKEAVAGCLQMIVRIDDYRLAFVELDGIQCLVSVLSGKLGFQLQYQLLFCVWQLAYNPYIVTQLINYNIVPVMAGILSEAGKEKVTRIILATFRNLLEKPAQYEVIQEFALSMIQCKVLKSLILLEAWKFDDPDIEDDLKYLIDKLQYSVQEFSSFDEYTTEVKSGRLEWSPVHRSEKFWRENAIRLNEHSHELLKILTKLLECSKEPIILSVAAHDVGQYVRHHPRGKHTIENLGCKQHVMQLMTHDDPTVRYEALIAVQKLMVHNWEYLGKQLQTATS